MTQFVWRSGRVTETPMWLPVNDGGLGGIPFAPLGRGTVSWAFSQGWHPGLPQFAPLGQGSFVRA